LIDFSLKGAKDPIAEFLIKFKKNSYFKIIVDDIKKVKTLKSKPHSLMVKKLGMACSYPGTFNSSIHSIINSTNYKGAVLRTIKAGGCNCSRVNFIGAYFAALKGIDTIPKSWIKKTNLSRKILDQK
jgi:ADP-ribosylglycohydrolase